MNRKAALIIGLSGQDGSILGDKLLEKDYRVFGAIRRNATRDLGNAKHLEKNIDIIECDVTDMSSMLKIIQRTRPHELYLTAAQSHVHTSFEQPIATLNIDTIGVVNVLESLKSLGFSTRMLFCSTSELFGKSPAPQNFDTPFIPQSPYAIAKLASHHFVRLYREAYNIYCCSALTFNHEEPGRRGPLFVTRKISLGVAQCLKDPNFKLKMGNIDAKRDWTLASDCCDGFITMLQQPKADDFIFASGETHSVREFLEIAFSHVGLNWKDHVEIDRLLKRPAEVNELCGDYSKAKEILGWEPTTSFEDLVKKMVDYDCYLLGVKREDETQSF